MRCLEAERQRGREALRATLSRGVARCGNAGFCHVLPWENAECPKKSAGKMLVLLFYKQQMVDLSTFSWGFTTKHMD
jgi:hypothetical protein